MRNKIRSFLALLVVAMFSVCMAGCYSIGDHILIAEYKKQAKINAVNYIKDKYGFEAKAVDAECKVASAPGQVINIDPTPSSEVTVKLKYNKKTFYVSITGRESSTEGTDNYQFEEIKNDIENTLNDIAGTTLEELFVCYGGYILEHPTSKTNGMIAEYYDGENLTDIFGERYVKATVSIIDQDINNFDPTLIEEKTGIDWIMFVNYDSKKHYDEINRPYYNLTGSPTEWGIEEKLIYINEYRIIGSNYDEYYNCVKAEYDGVIVATVDEHTYLTIEETTIDPANEWAGSLDICIKVSDAYAIKTDAKTVQVYMPLKNISWLPPSAAKIVLQYGESKHDTPISTKITDDSNYLTANVYNHEDYDDIRIAALVEI